MKSKLKFISEFEPREAIFCGSLSIMALGLMMCSQINKKENTEKLDLKPVNISVQECTIDVDGKESIYECKEIKSNPIKSEAKEHYNKLMHDTCVVDMKDEFNHIVRCYDESKDKIKHLENKANNKEKMKMICLNNKKNKRIKCFRN